jgi:Protein of unknown function (DUF742)
VTAHEINSTGRALGKRRRTSRWGPQGARGWTAPQEAPDSPPPVAADPAQRPEFADFAAWLRRPERSALVRPYAHTRGRTRSSYHLALEALVCTDNRAFAILDQLPSEQHRTIAVLCAQPRSVAEVAALLPAPLGVARVLLGDLAAAGAVVVHQTGGDTPNIALLQRVLRGLRRL